MRIVYRGKALGGGLVVVMALFVLSCVDLYRVDIAASKTYLVVEGTLTTLTDRQYIQIARTKSNSVFRSTEFTATIVAQRGGTEPVTGATVSVLENGQIRHRLTEDSPGRYAMPVEFIGKVGHSYQLDIETPSGERYQSRPETLAATPPIKRVYERFNSRGILDRTTSVGQIATNDFYIDFDDPANERNFYRWTSITYELQSVCASCRGGRYYPLLLPSGVQSGECRTDNTLPANNFFEYECDAFCWEFFPGTSLTIFSDVFTNGTPQTDLLVAQVPLYQRNPCLVVIQQIGLSANAYRYLKLIQDQSVNTGTLADTPPAPIQGNITNVADPTELILGYFGASQVEEVRYWLTRNNTEGAVFNSLFAIKTGRQPVFESPSDVRDIVPKARCITAGNRTAISPAGWRFL